eukprot:235268_1
MSPLNIPTPMIGLSLSISNASDVGGWLGMSSKFQNTISVREYALFDTILCSNHHQSRHIPYIKQCYSFCTWNTSGGIIIFVSSRKHCRRLASDIVALSTFILRNISTNAKTISHPNSGLYKCLSNGIGSIHEYTNDATKSDVCKFYKSGAIRVLIVTAQLSYNIKMK